VDRPDRRRRNQFAAAAAFDHVLGHLAERQEDAGQVHVDHRVPLVEGRLQERTGEAHACVREARVDATEAFDHGGGLFDYALLLGDVAAEGLDLGPEFCDFFRSRAALRLIASPERELRSCLCEPAGEAQADARVATGYECYVSCQIEHLVPFCRR
jgi:hypothetical protein